MDGEIAYSTDKDELTGLSVSGFFEGWEHRPSDEILIKSILGADFAVLAIDKKQAKLIGYITALSDGILAAYIPFLEVLPEYRNKGIGHSLVHRIIQEIGPLYMIDLVCDKELAGFYEEAGFKSWHAMIKRDYHHQRGKDM